MILNKTPHEITLFDETKKLNFKFPTTGEIFTIPETYQKSHSSPDGVILKKLKFRKQNFILPKFDPDTYYIVSSIFKFHYPDRRDLIVPKGFIRDEQNNIIACTFFAY